MRMVIFILMLVFLSAAAFAGEPYDRLWARNRIRPLHLSDVKLKGELKRQLDDAERMYANLNCDDLLKDYRERAGQEAPGWGMDYGYISHSPFGQFMSGFARLYAVTGKEKYKTKALYLMDKWAETIEEDGYCFAARPSFITPYYYDKLITAMMDIYNYCGEPRALEYIKPITSWAENNLDRTRKYVDTTGMGTGEWYTISDHLYKLYVVTGDERYRDFAKVWEYTEWWDEIDRGDWDAIYKRDGWHHAYSHVNSFNGLGGAYAAGGEERYLNILRKAYDFMQSEQCFATGGYGSGENLINRPGTADQIRYGSSNFETQCASWAAFKICKYLEGFTGDARYGDWTERLIINAVCASLPVLGNGRAFYYSDYKASGAAKRFNDTPWSCCTGTRILNDTDLGNQLYFVDDRDIYVNQYFAAEAAIALADGNVTLSCDSDFPESDRAEFVLRTEKPRSFRMHFRLPGWLADRAVVSVNGSPVKYEEKNHWAAVYRQWKDGDRIEVVLPMELKAEYLFGDRDYPYAIVYGPVVMAVKAMKEERNPAVLINPDTISEDFVRAEADDMTWISRKDRTLMFRPFYDYPVDQRYHLYLDPNLIFNGDYSDGWGIFDRFRASRNPGDWCEYPFEGRTIRYNYRSFDDCGIAAVYLDGRKYCDLDLYSKKRDVPGFLDIKAEASGKHTVKISVTPDRNPESAGTYVNICGFEVIE